MSVNNRDGKSEHKLPSEEQAEIATDVSERFAKVWKLTVDAWAKKGIDITNQRMRRDVARVIRRKRHD